MTRSLAAPVENSRVVRTAAAGPSGVRENQQVSLDEIADRLYALPLEEFTPARKQAERELRQGGEREQADRVKALRKPTAAAGAVNRLVRSHRSEVETFLEAAAKLRDAQLEGKGGLGAVAEAERAALEELVDLGGESVRASLQAAAVDDEIARDLLAARLVREPEPAGFDPPTGTAGTTSASRTSSRPPAPEGSDMRLFERSRSVGNALDQEVDRHA
jgi:hypothetical protein